MSFVLACSGQRTTHAQSCRSQQRVLLAQLARTTLKQTSITLEHSSRDAHTPSITRRLAGQRLDSSDRIVDDRRPRRHGTDRHHCACHARTRSARTHESVAHSTNLAQTSAAAALQTRTRTSIACHHTSQRPTRSLRRLQRAHGRWRVRWFIIAALLTLVIVVVMVGGSSSIDLAVCIINRRRSARRWRG
jgi:hypothetical protein